MSRFNYMSGSLVFLPYNFHAASVTRSSFAKLAPLGSSEFARSYIRYVKQVLTRDSARSFHYDRRRNRATSSCKAMFSRVATLERHKIANPYSRAYRKGKERGVSVFAVWYAEFGLQNRERL